MSSTIRLDNTSDQAADRPVVAAPAGPRLEPGSAPTVILRREESGPAPLSFAQERFWFLDRINPDDASSNISRGVRIKGDLKRDLLQRSLQAIVDRHESLRTTFATNQLYAVKDSKPVQLIAVNKTHEITVIDLSHESVDQREAKARDLAQGAAQRPFDLTLGPLLQATLLRLGGREHVLIVTLHRIVSDEWSLDVFFRDLWQLYKAGMRGNSSQLPQLPIQYADYARWQRTVIQSEALQADGNYWRAKLQGAPAANELPTDRPRPAIQSGRGASAAFVLKKELTGDLRALSDNEDATLFMTLMAALQILISRCSGQDDIVVGSTVANRELDETRNLIGPISNALALRVDLSGNPTFREVLARVKEVTLAAEAHRALPFEKLVDELQLERSLSYAPVYQIALNFKDTSASNTEVDTLIIGEFDFQTGMAKLDLTLDIVNKQDRLACRSEYNSDLFDAETIERLVRHFEVLLEGIVVNPEQRIAELPLLTEEERRQVLIEWNSAKNESTKGECIHELFESQVKRTPNATAVVCRDDRLSYDELNRRANQLARCLRALGIGPEQSVGVCLERSVETVIGLLATLKAGAAYVPLDPAYPRDRLSFMLEDSRVPALITQKRLLGTLPAPRAEVIQIDEDWPRIAGESDANLECPVAPENLAYVIYTSGSTGRPKGVQVTHGTVTHLFEATRQQLGFREGDVWTTVHSSAFDFSVWEIWGSLLQGTQLVIVLPEVAQSPAALHDLLRRERVTILNQTPAALRQLLGARPEFHDLNLRMIICGGDALDYELAQELTKIGIPVWNFYGPTESTVWATCTRVEPGAASEDLTSIGRQIPDIEIYLVDQHLQPVPVGVPGEICIGGDGLARGYLNRPELTAEKFIPNPFSEKRGTRLYKTGDLARYRRGGKIEFLERLDNQVKLRGFRIELGEVEAVLSQHPRVRQAVAIVREDQRGDKRLVAYLVPAAASVPGASELRAHLRRTLPEYMVPSSFVPLNAIPLTPNGKVDRRALPAPDESRPDLQQAYVAPRDRFEEQLATMWANVLQLKLIGVRDNFFELGGHSLLAARLFAQIENQFGKHLPLATLFQSPTVEQLANALRDTGASGAWSSLVAIQPKGSRPPLFCIHAAGANVLIYRPLSQHLGGDQPVYALQAQGLDGETKPHFRIEDMAAHYIEVMRTVQPNGPYYLVGASFGGLVVFEMAHQLLAQGQETALLAMLNTNCPASSITKRIFCHFGHVIQWGPRAYIQRLSKSVMRKRDNQDSTNGKAIADKELRQILESLPDPEDPLSKTIVAINVAEQNYVLTGKTYPGRITLFWAKDAKRDFEDNRMGWRRLAAGGLEVHVVPGNHTSIREEPNVAVLVEKLKRCLDGARLTQDQV